jgi:hypothetical protein
MTRRSRLAVALTLAAASALAACGSTVSSAQRAQTGAAGDGLGAASAAESGLGDPLAGDAGTGAASAAGNTATGGRRAGAAATAGNGSAASTRKVGVTATEISIGFGTSNDAAEVGKTFGLAASFGDQEAQAKAVVEDLNKRGGVLGRKISLVLHDTPTASTLQDPNSAQQAQCTDWTEDHKVFAAINIVGDLNQEVQFGCMVKHHTPLVISDLAGHSVGQIGRFAPYLYAAGVATVDRYVPAWIDQLVADNYFTSWDTITGAPGATPVKIGVPYTDNEVGRQYFKVVQQALAAHNLAVGDSFAFSANAAEGVAQISSTVVRFRSNGVTHVLLPESAYLVTPAAEQQRYRPRYGVTTLDGLASLTVATSPPGQLNGALGLGWLPQSDVDAAHDPGPVSPAQTHCLDVMDKAGQTTSDRLAQTTQLIVCDAFNFLVAALNGGGDVTPDAFRRGVALLGSGFPSAITFQERYGPNRYDGAAAGRGLAYQAACNCFVYSQKSDRPFPA